MHEGCSVFSKFYNKKPLLFFQTEVKLSEPQLKGKYTFMFRQVHHPDPVDCYLPRHWRSLLIGFAGLSRKLHRCPKISKAGMAPKCLNGELLNGKYMPCIVAEISV